MSAAREAPAAGARAVGRDGAVYLVARVACDALGLLALALYTRLLAPEAFGWYVVALSCAGLAHALGLSWLSLGLARFLPERAAGRGGLGLPLGAVLGALLPASALLAAVACAAAGIARPGHVLLVAAFVWANAAFEVTLEVVRARLAPARHAALSVVRSVLAFVLGVAALLAGLGGPGLLGAMTLALAAAAALELHGTRAALGGARPETDLVRRMAAYAMPIALVQLFAFVLDSADRIVVARLAGEAAAGGYGAAYGLAKQAVLAVVAPIGLAGFPLAVRALAEAGPQAARDAVRRATAATLLVVCPAAAALAAFAPLVARVAVGPAQRPVVEQTLPWLAAAMLLVAAQQYHVQRAFTLSRRTGALVAPAAAASLANVLLNVLLVPAHGPLGAAWATLGAYALYLLLSWAAGRSLLRLDFPWGAAARSALATIALLAGVHAAAPDGSIAGWGRAAVAGALAWLATLLATSLAGGRGAADVRRIADVVRTALPHRAAEHLARRQQG